MSGSDLMLILARGNPGALSVVSRLDYIHLAKLQRMDITGSMIWVGYKDICDEDIAVFKSKVEDGSIEKLVKDTPDYKYEKRSKLR